MRVLLCSVLPLVGHVLRVPSPPLLLIDKVDNPPAALLEQALQSELPQLSSSVISTSAAAAPSTATADELTTAIAQLENAGLCRSDITSLVSRRPKSALRLLCRPQAELLSGLEALPGLSDIGALLRSQPRILELDAARLRDAIKFLEGYVGAGRVGEFITLHPQALLWRDANELPVAQHLRALGLNKRVIDSIRKGLPTIDSLTSAENVAALLSYCQHDLGFSTPARLGQLLQAYPQLIGLSLEENVRPTVEYMASVGVQDVAAAIKRHPQLLGLSITKNLQPTVEYLTSLGVDAGKAAGINPSLLALSIEGNLMPTVRFLSEEVGMASLGRALTAQPTILALSVSDNLRPKVEYLREIGLETAPGGLGAQLDAYPALLTLSLDKNIRPTADALQKAGLLLNAADGEEEMVATMLRPRHLAASLDGRVRPRIAFVELHAEYMATLPEEKATRVGRFGRPTLSMVTTVSDATFAKQLGVDAADYATFRKAFGGGEATKMTGLNIPWLPEGFDLSAALLDDLSGRA